MVNISLFVIRQVIFYVSCVLVALAAPTITDSTIEQKLEIFLNMVDLSPSLNFHIGHVMGIKCKAEYALHSRSHEIMHHPRMFSVRFSMLYIAIFSILFFCRLISFCLFWGSLNLRKYFNVGNSSWLLFKPYTSMSTMVKTIINTLTTEVLIFLFIFFNG